jgi:hypothetical protein
LQAIAQKAQSQHPRAAEKRMLESGCLGYFDWTKIAVVAPISDTSLPSSGSDVVQAPPQPKLVLLILSALVAML